jgi:hypothetical protein
MAERPVYKKKYQSNSSAQGKGLLDEIDDLSARLYPKPTELSENSVPFEESVRRKREESAKAVKRYREEEKAKEAKAEIVKNAKAKEVVIHDSLTKKDNKKDEKKSEQKSENKSGKESPKKQTTVKELFEAKTGKPWSEAKKLGLTDGSKDANLKLAAMLKSGKSLDELKHKNLATVKRNMVTDYPSSKKNESEDETYNEDQDDTVAGMNQKTPYSNLSDDDKNRVNRTTEYIKGKAEGSKVAADGYKKGSKNVMNKMYKMGGKSVKVEALISEHKKPARQIERDEKRNPRMEKQELSAFEKLKTLEKKEMGEKDMKAKTPMMKNGKKTMNLSKYKC